MKNTLGLDFCNRSLRNGSRLCWLFPFNEPPEKSLGFQYSTSSRPPIPLSFLESAHLPLSRKPSRLFSDLQWCFDISIENTYSCPIHRLYSRKYFESDRFEWKKHEDENELLSHGDGCGGFIIFLGHAFAESRLRRKRGLDAGRVLFFAYSVDRFRELVLGGFHLVNLRELMKNFRKE